MAMRQAAVHCFWIVVAASVICFTNLGRPALWDEDEPLYASCAREMCQRGDWVVPYYNGEMFPDKPPLMFWTMMLGYQLFGVTELGARFFSAVFAVVTAVVTYQLGRRLFCAEVGFWAGLIVPSSLIFTVSARAATVDSALTLATLLALSGFVATGMGRLGSFGADELRSATGGAGGRRQQGGRVFGRRLLGGRSWWAWAWFWFWLAVAVLAKGPVGLLLPAASVGLFLMIMNSLGRQEAARRQSPGAGRTEPTAADPGGRGLSWWRRVWAYGLGGMKVVASVWSPRNFLASLWRMRPLSGMVIVAAIAGPWFVQVAARNPEMLRQFLAKFNWRPFTQPILGHSGPFWYYVPAVVIGFFPWSAFLGQSLVGLVRRFRTPGQWTPGHLLLACWIGVWVIFWSVCRTKLPHYLLPIYPALSLMTALFLHELIRFPQRANWRWLRLDLTSTMLVGVGLVVVFPAVAAFFVPSEWWLGLVGLILVAGAAVARRLAARRQVEWAVRVFAVMSVAWLTAIFGLAALRIDRHQVARPLMAEIEAAGQGEWQVAVYRFLRPSLVFYAGQPVAVLRNEEDVARFLASSPRPYVITLDEHGERLKRLLPGQLEEVSRRPRFLRPGEVVVLAPRRDSPRLLTADRMAPGRTR